MVNHNHGARLKIFRSHIKYNKIQASSILVEKHPASYFIWRKREIYDFGGKGNRPNLIFGKKANRRKRGSREPYFGNSAVSSVLKQKVVRPTVAVTEHRQRLLRRHQAHHVPEERLVVDELTKLVQVLWFLFFGQFGLQLSETTPKSSHTADAHNTSYRYNIML